MFTYKDKYETTRLTFVGGMTVGGSIFMVALTITCLCMWGCPQWNVYHARKEGEAQLAHAQSSKEVAVAEAKAKMEASEMLAQADTIRAHGIAASNQIIGKSLENNPSYLQWLFIDQLKDTKDQIIYVPSGTMGMPVLEANRLARTSQQAQ